MASAAAVRTDSSRSCKSGTSAGTAGAAAFFSAPSARAADALTGALASCSSSTSAATVAPVSPPTSPRASAAWQRTVSSASFNKPISLGATAAAGGPIRPSAGAAWVRTAAESSARADSRVATASSTGSRGRAGATRFFRTEQPRDPTPLRAAAPGEAALRACGSRPRAAEDPQGFDHALPHHVAGVLGECGQRGHRVQGVELAERGGGDGPHVLVRVVQMTDQGRDGRGADRRQDQRQLVPLLLGQRRDRAQRHQQRPDGQGTVDWAARSGPARGSARAGSRSR